MFQPRYKCLGQAWVHWNGFLRRFRLTRADDLLDDRSNHADLASLESDVTPFQTEQLAHAQAGNRIDEYQRTFFEGKGCNELADFVGSQYQWDLLAFCALSYKTNRFHAANTVTDGVVEQNAHDVSDLGAR